MKKIILYFFTVLILITSAFACNDPFTADSSVTFVDFGTGEDLVEIYYRYEENGDDYDFFYKLEGLEEEGITFFMPGGRAERAGVIDGNDVETTLNKLAGFMNSFTFAEHLSNGLCSDVIWTGSSLSGNPPVLAAEHFGVGGAGGGAGGAGGDEIVGVRGTDGSGTGIVAGGSGSGMGGLPTTGHTAVPEFSTVGIIVAVLAIIAISFVFYKKKMSSKKSQAKIAFVIIALVVIALGIVGIVMLGDLDTPVVSYVVKEITPNGAIEDRVINILDNPDGIIFIIRTESGKESTGIIPLEKGKHFIVGNYDQVIVE